MRTVAATKCVTIFKVQTRGQVVLILVSASRQSSIRAPSLKEQTGYETGEDSQRGVEGAEKARAERGFFC